MARIPLLFSLAFALTLGSLFLSVSGHPRPAQPRKPLCPKTVSEVQTLPFTEMTEFLNRKERLAPKTPEFKVMFTVTKDYITYLKTLYKYENPIVDVLGIAKIKYALMTNAILAAQASVTGKTNMETSLGLKKRCTDLAKGFHQVTKTIVKISAKHHYKADAKIKAREAEKLDHAMVNFRISVHVFMNVVKDLEKMKMKNVNVHARTLAETRDARSAFEKFFGEFASGFGSYFGSRRPYRGPYRRSYRRLEETQDDRNAFQRFLGNFTDGFGSYFGSRRPNRELTENVSLKDFFNQIGVDGNSVIDAAGKMNFAGKDGFRSVNKPHYKHFVSTEA